MTDRELINQLKTLRSIHPDRNWVVLMRSKFAETSPRAGVLDIFSFIVPRPLAIPVMVAVVALIGGIAMFQQESYTGNFVASVRHKSLSVETREEIKEIAYQHESAVNQHKSADYTVVFNEDADAQESFKDALRNRIESKIGKIHDLFAQLEDGDLAREISLNPRRYEENFKLADGELGKQVKSLLADAEAALAEGNLIDALDLVNAIERLLD